MSRMGNIITDDNYYMYMIDIGTNIVDKIIYGLRERYTARFEPVPDINPLAYNLLIINLFYDVERPRLYVTYRLDEDRTIGVKWSDSELYNRIYSNLRMAEKEEDIPITVIGEPTRLPQFSNYRQYGVFDQDDYWLRADTQFLWYAYNGDERKSILYPYFIENKAQLKSDIAKSGISKSRLDEYMEEVKQINLTYLRTNQGQETLYPEYSDFQDAFDEYKLVYKSFFGRDVVCLDTNNGKPNWKTISIFINVQHDVYAEKSSPQIHDCGTVENFGRVPQYIREWAIENGKPVPD